jgi:hypothetical protein
MRQALQSFRKATGGASVGCRRRLPPDSKSESAGQVPIHGEPRSHDGDWRPCGCGRERGSAVVDFVLVGSLLTVIFIAITQLALVLHVRNTLIDAAASGARYASLADREAADARSRTEALISMALNDSYAHNVSVDQVTYRGAATIEVNVMAPLPVIGLIGPGGVVEVSGHAATTN